MKFKRNLNRTPGVFRDGEYLEAETGDGRVSAGAGPSNYNRKREENSGEALFHD